MRVGIGFDAHKLAEGRRLVLGGVNIPTHRGLCGHSDADVLVHAIMDAMLGAAGLGDIGRLFPDSDQQYKNIDSTRLLKKVCDLLKDRGFVCHNLDCIIVAQYPRLAPYREEMQKNISLILNIDPNQVNIKATTTEGLGFTGREEGIAAYAVCTIQDVQES